MEPQCFSASAKDTDTQSLCIGVFLFSCVNSLVGLVNIPYQNRQIEYCTQTGTTGQQDIHDAIQDGGNEDQDDHDEGEGNNQEEIDFEFEIKEGFIPKDLDGWHWAFSDSESEGEENVKDTVDKGKPKDPEAHAGGTSGHKIRVAESRPEYIELKAAGLVMKPEGATLGVFPGGSTWRGSYPGSKHYGRTWGPNRSPKKALLEVLKLILEDHVSLNPKDKIAKTQLTRYKSMASSVMSY